MKGTITRFFPERHFGFVLYEEGELFFHELDATDLPKPIERGAKVEFTPGIFKGRAKATNLRVADPVSEGSGQ